MSQLTETKKAYNRVRALLDQELLARKNNAQYIRECQAAVDVAFYLLGWAQFEHKIKQEAKEKIKEQAKAKIVQGVAWNYMLANVNGVPLRKLLDIIFFGQQAVLTQLHKDYDVRNDAAHNYKRLPPEARDISSWLEHLEELLDKL